MKNKLFKNILAAMAITLGLSLILIIITLNQNFSSIEVSRLSAEAALAATGIETGGEKYLDNLDEQEYRITWIDKDGTVLFDNETDASKMENHSGREEFIEARKNGEGSIKRYSSTIAQETWYYAKELKDGTVVRVAQTNDSVLALTLRLATPILWIYVLAIAVSAVLANRLSARIAEPINHIDLDHPLENKTYEEIRPLLSRISFQNSQIEKQVEVLHRKKKEFRTITDNISEALLIINLDGRIVSSNNAVLTLFGIEKDHIEDLLKEEEIQKVLTSAMNGKDDEAVMQKEGLTIRIVGKPIFSRKVLTGASILAYDITETYSAEVQRREFSANVSHELKTPLQTIMGSTELLQNGLVKPGDEKQFYDRIHSESARMLTLIDDIIRLSQLDEDGSSEESDTLLDLKDVGNETMESLHQAAAKKNIHIINQLESAHVRANNRMIYEIFYNLIDNAIRYSDADTSITIRSFEEDEHSILSVKDQGCGIPKEAQSRIFERFYRVDKSHSRATGGTGLGLSIVKHSVARCHGTISLQSEPGKGSTFTVSFPKA